ncbi:MAG: SCO family protein [Bacteroidia bacterium]
MRSNIPLWKGQGEESIFLILLFLASLLLFACQANDQVESRVAKLPYYDDPTFTAHWFATGSDSLNDFHQIPDFELINQEGDTITQATFADKIYVTDFFFTTCPGICPKMTKNMVLLQDAFLEEADVMLLSHSVTPAIDSVEVLQMYAEYQGVNSDKWYLTTGERDLIYRLGRTAYFVEEDLGIEKDIDEFLHTENFVLIDKNRHIRGIYNGLNKTAIRQLIADVKTLQEEG